MTFGVISHENCIRHNMGDSHPESPLRLLTIQEYVERFQFPVSIQHFRATSIPRDLLLLAHEKHYIEHIFSVAPIQGYHSLDADTLMMPDTLPAALLAAGAVTQAVDKILTGELKTAFCAVRPPGHHAESDKAMGFCIFNNIAIGAAYALEQHGLKKVAILDFDVHHGNGTEQIFRDRPQVLFCSTFQSPFYPFSGTGDTPTNIINTPLSANSSSREFREAVTNQWLPALEDFAPEMLFISAGFDAHVKDTMSQLNFFEADYLWVTQQLKSFADRICNGRIVSSLEGGYEMRSLGDSVVAHINGLITTNA